MNKIFKSTIIAISGFAMIGFAASCSETDAEKDKGATPVIKYARMCNLELSDSLIVSASLGSRIAFVGNNLGDVQQVWFNDQKAKLNPTMVTSHTIIVDIPNNIPGEVSNIAKFITSDGISVDYPFGVTVPAPKVDAITCEYARPGDIVTISGAYFADDPNVPLTVTFPGDIQAAIKSLSQDELVIEIPQCTEEGPITVSTIYGDGKSSFHYLDTQGMLFDFDGLTGLSNHGWHDRPIENDGSGISGNYMVLGDGSTTLSAAADWDDSNFSFEYWAGDWTDPVSYPHGTGDRLFDIADFSDYNNLALKFEVCIPAAGAWQAGALQMIFMGTDIVSMGNAGVDVYGNTVAGCNNDYISSELARGLWTPWSATEAYHTDGEWITVSFPISDFLYKADGSTATKYLSSPSDFAGLCLFLNAGGVTGVECTPLIKIDNIRVVKK